MISSFTFNVNINFEKKAMEKILISFWNPSEIADKIPGISTRQITDLAEKRIIEPYKQTLGRGLSRLYTTYNVFEIMCAISVRGKIEPYCVQHMLECIESFEKDFKETADEVMINWSVDKETPEFSTCKISVYSFSENKVNNKIVTQYSPLKIDTMDFDKKTKEFKEKRYRSEPEKYPPFHPNVFSEVVINIKGIREFVDSKFK